MQAPGHLELHWELDSTSSELQRQGQQLPDLAFVLAETQSAGRGRRGRRWLSPPGLNLYLSCYKRFERGVAALGGLPLAVGVMLVEALQGLGVTDIGLKWPNDIISPQGKLAGILVELSGESQGPCSAVIGIGVNLRLTPAMRETLDQTAADLHALLPADRLLDRNHCAAAIIGALCQGLRRFEDDGYALFHAAYTQHDRLQGSRLQIHRPNGSRLEGIGAGTDAQGALQLATDAGLERIDSAEVSVRPG
ncbi:biotin-acetyl-carboxylase ligase [Lasius niger]|uniref:Biotin-acetyl-carboxylase ligase n=1 Tax=Lasius niger TaxID=67767 RepID=A0A0J7MPW5_LASNI|nr:biotin-acetyl-carboxylase ligase [Lasius niger]